MQHRQVAMGTIMEMQMKKQISICYRRTQKRNGFQNK